MNILLICSSIEPGRDGVGDYAIRLAQELHALGHKCKCIAINDCYLFGNLLQANQHEDRMRLPQDISWQERTRFVQKLVFEFNPNFISLQYVPNGYSRKGIPLLLPNRLASIRGNFKWHIMFHELWIEPKGLYRQLLSILQRHIVTSLYTKLNPLAAHTSNPNYSDKLAHVGICLSVLPLFSNIDLVSPNNQLRSDLIKKMDFKVNSDQIWIFVFFGSIYPGWDYRSFLERVLNAARLAMKKGVIFISIGKNLGKGAEIWNTIQSYNKNSLKFLRLGELSAPDVSRYLQASDFGVATTPLGLLGKSGSAAAMASHGLTTIVPQVDVLLPRDIIEKTGLVPLDELFEQGLLNPPKPSDSYSAREIAKLFLKNLGPCIAMEP